MSEISVTEHDGGLRVSSPWWEIVHSAAAGGAWNSIVLKHGSGRNLLRGPAGSALRFVRADPGCSAGVFTSYSEKHEKAPVLRVEEERPQSGRIVARKDGGVPVVVAEGTYRDEQGQPLPVGYRRRTAYHDHGLIWTTLEIMSDAGCDGVVEVRALELPLHAGFTDCLARLHPTQGGGADLLGAQGRFELGRPACATDTPSQREGLSVPPGRARMRPGQTACATDMPSQREGLSVLPEEARMRPGQTAGPATSVAQTQGCWAAFVSRYTPLQVLCSGREHGGDTIELFPGSELAEWDCAFKPEPGLGLNSVSRNEEGVEVLLSPYCMGFRRLGLRLQGNVRLRLGVALPGVSGDTIPISRTAGNRVMSPEIGYPSLRNPEEEVARLARAGVRLLRFRDDYREGRPCASSGRSFWRNGAYPPYDEGGMSELKRLIEAAHRHGLKIVAYVSLKELHPDTPAFREHAREWMHQAAPSLGMIHNWIGSGESGALMCMKSGWQDHCKRYVDEILSGLPWDGLELDLATFHACCHPEHGRGPFHSGVDNVLDLLGYCRERVGKQGVLTLCGGGDSIVARNLAGL